MSGPPVPNIISFKAGRAFRREGTNWVDPDPRKGLVSIQTGEDGLLRFLWTNRDNNHVEEELILFPGDATFVPVTQADGGRVYVLKFSSSDQRLFFWMQRKDASQDEQNVTKLNRALSEFGSGDLMSTDEPEDEIAAAAEALLAQPSTSTAPPSTLQPAAPQMSPEELARIRQMLQSLGARGSMPAGRANVGFQEPELSLTDVLTPKALAPLFANPELLASVFPNLPDDLPVSPSPETIRRIVDSPPFQASLRQLDQALATGQLQGLMSGLGLPQEAGTSVSAFLKAIADQAKRRESSGSSGRGS